MTIPQEHVSGECTNCDGRKCMGCVFREYDHDCADDCPNCCAPKQHGVALTMPQEHVNAVARAVEEAVLDAYERHIEPNRRGRCSCGFAPPAHIGGSLHGDILFQHISGAIADAADKAIRAAIEAWKEQQ